MCTCVPVLSCSSVAVAILYLLSYSAVSSSTLASSACQNTYEALRNLIGEPATRSIREPCPSKAWNLLLVIGSLENPVPVEPKNTRIYWRTLL